MREIAPKKIWGIYTSNNLLLIFHLRLRYTNLNSIYLFVKRGNYIIMWQAVISTSYLFFWSFLFSLFAYNKNGCIYLEYMEQRKENDGYSKDTLGSIEQTYETCQQLLRTTKSYNVSLVSEVGDYSLTIWSYKRKQLQ